jgi:predicted acylesterase/phospholipase RssA
MVFEPVKIYGYILADGGILNNVAADVAATFNPEMIIAVDIMANHHLAIEPDNFLKVGLRALLLMTNELKSLRISIAEVAIVPNLTNIPYMSGRDNQQAFEAGMHAARANLH